MNHKRRADVGDQGKAAADNHCLSGGVSRHKPASGHRTDVCVADYFVQDCGSYFIFRVIDGVEHEHEPGLARPFDWR